MSTFFILVFHSSILSLEKESGYRNTLFYELEHSFEGVLFIYLFLNIYLGSTMLIRKEGAMTLKGLVSFGP